REITDVIEDVQDPARLLFNPRGLGRLASNQKILTCECFRMHANRAQRATSRVRSITHHQDRRHHTQPGLIDAAASMWIRDLRGPLPFKNRVWSVIEISLEYPTLLQRTRRNGQDVIRKPFREPIHRARQREVAGVASRAYEPSRVKDDGARSGIAIGD